MRQRNLFPDWKRKKGDPVYSAVMKMRRLGFRVDRLGADAHQVKAPRTLQAVCGITVARVNSRELIALSDRYSQASAELERRRQ